MSDTTRMPAVVSALVNVITEVVPSLQVIDGSTVGELADGVVVVGFYESPEQPGYSTALEKMEGTGTRARYLERWTVHAMLSLASGNSDLAGLRAQAGTHLATIVEALRVGGTPRPWDANPMMTNTQWMPFHGPKGTVVNVLFDLESVCIL